MDVVLPFLFTAVLLGWLLIGALIALVIVRRFRDEPEPAPEPRADFRDWLDAWLWCENHKVI